jgi:uncharacterized protein
MTDYSKKTYGRNAEIAYMFSLFKAGKDISQHGPRRLGKTFVLDRMVEQASPHKFICIKVEIAGCTEPKMVFRRLCEEIAANSSVTKRTISIIVQRMAQVINPRVEQAGSWYQPFINVDWEKYLERLLSALQDDKEIQWAILIDELPIFLKAMHDKGVGGINQARDFMNLFSQLRSKNPRVRWLVTGSIGIDPLAREGQYMGALAKFHPYQLEPLSEPQAIDYLKDLAQLGLLQGRKAITDQEAQAVIEAVGWRAAFYLEAFANKLPPNPETDPIKVQENIDSAMVALLKPHNKTTLGTWEEHIRKHHSEDQRNLTFAVLNAIAPLEEGMTLDSILGTLGNANLKHETLRQHLMILIDEGFLYQEPFGDDNSPYRFRIAVLRQWWKTYRPQA